MRILPFQPSDVSNISHLQPDGWFPIEPYFKFYTESSFCSPLKIVKDEKILAIGTSIFHRQSAWVAHIIVGKDFRNQGIGTLITDALIKDIIERKFKTIQLVATPIGEPIYRKLGFQKDIEYAFVKNGTNTSEPNNILQSQPEYFDEIISLDSHASGEDRTELLTPQLKEAKVILDDRKVSGFYMPSLGEGLIVASNAEAGVKLMQFKHSKDFKYAAIPRPNDAALKFLHNHGYIEFRVGIRMWYGEKLSWHPEMLYGRIGGNLG